MTDYIDSSDLRDFIKDPGQLNETSFAAACTNASRKVEELCGRVFLAPADDAVASARYYWPDYYTACCIDDIASSTGLLVAVDSGGDGTYGQAWTVATDYFLEPLNRQQSGVPWPYTKLTATQSSKWFPTRCYPYIRPTVRVTTDQWGWPAVPESVVLASKIIAHYNLAVAGAPLGTNGMDGWGPVRVKGVPETALELLRPFMLAEYAIA